MPRLGERWAIATGSGTAADRPLVGKSVRWWIGLCDRRADRAPRRQDGVALAMLVPSLTAMIALAGASHGALLDHAWSGNGARAAALLGDR